MEKPNWTRKSEYVCMWVHGRGCVFMWMYVCVWVCAYVCVRVCIKNYIFIIDILDVMLGLVLNSYNKNKPKTTTTATTTRGNITTVKDKINMSNNTSCKVGHVKSQQRPQNINILIPRDGQAESLTCLYVLSSNTIQINFALHHFGPNIKKYNGWRNPLAPPLSAKIDSLALC